MQTANNTRERTDRLFPVPHLQTHSTEPCVSSHHDRAVYVAIICCLNYQNLLLSGFCASFLVCLNPSSPGFYEYSVLTVYITAPPVLKGPSISNIFVHNGFSSLYELSQYHSVSTASPVCPINHLVHSRLSSDLCPAITPEGKPSLTY